MADSSVVRLSEALGISEETVMKHYGVKGMKWGIRKKRVDLGIRRKGQEIAKKRKENQERKLEERQTRTRKNTETYRLETDELRAVVERMRLENEYEKLVNPKNEKRRNAGVQIVVDVASGVLKSVATDYSKHVINNFIRTYDPTYKPSSGSKKK